MGYLWLTRNEVTGMVVPASAASGELVAVRDEHRRDGRVAARELQRIRGKLRHHLAVAGARRLERLPADDLTAAPKLPQQRPVAGTWIGWHGGHQLGPGPSGV